MANTRGEAMIKVPRDGPGLGRRRRVLIGVFNGVFELIVGRARVYAQDAFPSAAITGVDLSPFFLSVGAYNQRMRRSRGVHSSSPEMRCLALHLAHTRLGYMPHEAPSLLGLRRLRGTHCASIQFIMLCVYLHTGT